MSVSIGVRSLKKVSLIFINREGQLVQRKRKKKKKKKKEKKKKNNYWKKEKSM